MSIRLRLGDEVFDIPTVGASNWGEQITLYLRKNSEIIATIQGPQDILLTPFGITGFTVGDESPSGNILGLSFDTSTIQQIIVDGIITREFNTGNPKVDSFRCEGIYDNANFYIDTNFTGTDAGVSLNINSTGQFTYAVKSVADTKSITIRFRAKAIIDV